MGNYEGPERVERTGASIVKFTGTAMTGSFTTYLEPGETVSLAEDAPNKVTVEVLEPDDGDGGDLLRCPSCRHEHHVDDRELVDGGRECPECGEPTAMVMGELDLVAGGEDG